MKEQILDRLVCLLKYFKGLEHENNEKEYAYILKGTINGITYSIKNLEDFFENEEYLAKNPPLNPEYNSTYWYLAPCTVKKKMREILFRGKRLDNGE